MQINKHFQNGYTFFRRKCAMLNAFNIDAEIIQHEKYIETFHALKRILRMFYKTSKKDVYIYACVKRS